MRQPFGNLCGLLARVSFGLRATNLRWLSLARAIRGPKMKIIRKILRNNKAATAIEYGLIAALIAVAAIAAMQGLGNQIKSTFKSANTGMGRGTEAK